MAPTSFDIFDLNDCFAVDEPPANRAGSQINDLFAVDEDPTNRASSSPEIVMPQSSENWTVLPCTPENMKRVVDALTPAEATLADYDSSLTKPGLIPDRRDPNPWDPRMIVDLALNIEPLASILECYGVDMATYDHLCTVPAFRRDLAVTMRELRENGLSYAKKAAVQAESYLLDVDEMIQDKAVAAATRLSAIQWVTKMGRLEPKEDKTDHGAAATTVNLQINFAH